MSADVPFDFYVGRQKLPAGQYEVKHMGDPSVLHVTDGKGHVSITFSNGQTNRSATRRGQLIFTRYGSQYFLSEVHWADSTLSRQLLKSPLEIQIARSTAAEQISASTRNR